MHDQPAPTEREQEEAHEGRQQEQIGAGGHERETAAAQVVAGKAQSATGPGRSGHEPQRQQKEAAQNRRDQDPVQHLERALDATAHRQNGHA